MGALWAFLGRLLWPSDALTFWTMVLALATIALTVVAAKGLYSLGLTKKDMRTRAQREAKACAIERAKEFAEQIAPKQSVIRDTLNAANVAPFLKSAGDLRLEPDPPNMVAAALTWWKTVPSPIQREMLFALNGLEAWAMHFTSGVADHELAAPPCARMFCYYVAQNYGALLWARDQAKGKSGNFPNIVKLFNSWRDGPDSQEFLASIFREMARLMPQKKEKLPPPIGTDI